MKDYGNLQKNNILERLYAIDTKLYTMYPYLSHRIKIYLAGSVCAVFYIEDYRYTYDIDVIKCNYEIKEELFREFDMNTSIQNIADMNIPDSFLQRAVPLHLNTLLIDYYLISLELTI